MVGLALAAGAVVVVQSGVLDAEPSTPGLVVGSVSSAAPAADPGGTAAAAPASRPTRALHGLKSRILDTGAVEVWGRTTLPDGSDVRVTVSAAGGSRIALPSAPSASGRFYVRARLPASWQGRRIKIRVQAEE